uniref:Uncharacterized protein n=1 Tax=Ciona intestinalis TaxID=7719 RepID=F6YSC5_CIOIN
MHNPKRKTPAATITTAPILTKMAGHFSSVISSIEIFMASASSVDICWLCPSSRPQNKSIALRQNGLGAAGSA